MTNRYDVTLSKGEGSAARDGKTRGVNERLRSDLQDDTRAGTYQKTQSFCGGFFYRIVTSHVARG